MPGFGAVFAYTAPTVRRVPTRVASPHTSAADLAFEAGYHDCYLGAVYGRGDLDTQLGGRACDEPRLAYRTGSAECHEQRHLAGQRARPRQRSRSLQRARRAAAATRSTAAGPGSQAESVQPPAAHGRAQTTTATGPGRRHSFAAVPRVGGGGRVETRGRVERPC